MPLPGPTPVDTERAFLAVPRVADATAARLCVDDFARAATGAAAVTAHDTAPATMTAWLVS